MFNESQLALLKRAVRVLAEHEQRVAGAVHEELTELYDLFHPAEVVEVAPVAEVEETAPVVEAVKETAPVVEDDATPASTDK